MTIRASLRTWLKMTKLHASSRRQQKSGQAPPCLLVTESTHFIGLKRGHRLHANDRGHRSYSLTKFHRAWIHSSATVGLFLARPRVSCHLLGKARTVPVTASLHFKSVKTQWMCLLYFALLFVFLCLCFAPKC